MSAQNAPATAILAYLWRNDYCNIIAIFCRFYMCMTIIYILALLSICMENPSAYLIYIFYSYSHIKLCKQSPCWNIFLWWRHFGDCRKYPVIQSWIMCTLISKIIETSHPTVKCLVVNTIKICRNSCLIIIFHSPVKIW